MAIATVCLLGVAVIAAGISYFQWREMHEGGVDTHDLAKAAKAQADATKAEADSMRDLAERSLRQAKATDELAKQSETSAKAAIESARDADISASATKSMAATSSEALDNARQNEQLDQRPWIAVTSLRLTKFQADAKLEAQLVFTNSGRSPALNVSVVGKVLNLDQKADPDFLLIAPAGDFTNFRATPPQGGNTWTADSGKPLEAADKEGVEKHRRTVWTFGFVRYEDTFGKAHVTQFCGYTRSGGVESAKVTEGMNLNLCPNQNGMD